MKVVVVSGVCVRFDAVSDAVKQNIDALNADPENEVTLFSYRCDYAELRHVDIGSPLDLISHPEFQSADLVIMHFAIRYSLFSALMATPRRAKLVVVFHNITPKSLLPSWMHHEIDESFKQLSLVSVVDHVICDSAYNAEVLRGAGIMTPATVKGLGVSIPLTPPEGKPSFDDGVLRIAYVGRFVKSKGPHDLLRALGQAIPDLPHDQVELTMMGSSQFSDRSLLEDLRASLDGLHAKYRRRVQAWIREDVSDATKIDVLRDADMFVLPTYHEGFCVPILESIASGCRVLSFRNSNVPNVLGGLGGMVETGDVSALAESLVDLSAEIGAPAWQQTSGGYADYRSRAILHVASNDIESTAASMRRIVREVMSTPQDRLRHRLAS